MFYDLGLWRCVKLPVWFSFAIVFSIYGAKPHEIGLQDGISLSYDPFARQVTWFWPFSKKKGSNFLSFVRFYCLKLQIKLAYNKKAI